MNNYKQVSLQESNTSAGNIGIKIFLDINRELTDEDKHNIRRATDELEKKILGESVRLDPKEKQEAQEERHKMEELFKGHAIYVEEIPNGYCSDWCCTQKPWFIFTTRVGRIKIGWRKSVISIDWSDSNIKKEADELFPDETSTKFQKGIHAWGYEKAAEYIKTLLS